MLYVQPEMGRVVTQKLGTSRVLAVDSRHLAQKMRLMIESNKLLESVEFNF